VAVAAICLLFAAAGGFVRASVREPTGKIEVLLGAAATLLAAAWAYDLLAPGVKEGITAGSVCLRTVCFGLILVVALQVHTQQRRAQVDAVVARERRRLAGDLHDGLAQDLALIAAYGQRLTRDLGVEHPVTLAAEHALAATRGVIVDLSASDQPTATDALRAVAGQLAHRFGVRVDVAASSEHLAGDERESVVRIAREAIVNAVTHGGAKQITVTLQTHGNQLMLRIDDDGCGLGHAVPAGQHSGHGLREMSEWAQAIGGHLTAQQGAHGGTAVRVLVS
jgi:signal transduction histidine kinase